MFRLTYNRLVISEMSLSIQSTALAQSPKNTKTRYDSLINIGLLATNSVQNHRNSYILKISRHLLYIHFQLRACDDGIFSCKNRKNDGLGLVLVIDIFHSSNRWSIGQTPKTKITPSISKLATVKKAEKPKVTVICKNCSCVRISEHNCSTLYSTEMFW